MNDDAPGDDWVRLTPEMVDLDLLHKKEFVRASALSAIAEVGARIPADVLEAKLRPLFERFERDAAVMRLRLQSVAERRRAMAVVPGGKA